MPQGSGVSPSPPRPFSSGTTPSGPQTGGRTFCPPWRSGRTTAWGTLSRNGGLEGRQYQTRQDPTNFAEPFLALCLTQTGDQVMEVVAGLDQKHYVQGPETLFQRKALYSLRVFFPELTEADFQTLYAQLSQDAQYAETWETPLPARVFYQDGVACYLLLQIGEYDQLHVRAADQALLDQWQAAGVELIQGFPTADGSAAGEKGDHTT